jgi:hypothetical protein
MVAGTARGSIMKPGNLLIGSYVCHMADEGDQMKTGIQQGQKNVYNSVRGRLGTVSSMLQEFGTMGVAMWS